MPFNIVSTGTESEFVSRYDTSIDWGETEEQHGFTAEDYEENTALREERIDKLVFLSGQEPTVFHLEIPRSSIINKLSAEEQPIRMIQLLAMRHIKRADNWLDSKGQPVPIKHKKNKELEVKAQDALPAITINEIGGYLLDRGNGLSDPLAS